MFGGKGTGWTVSDKMFEGILNSLEAVYLGDVYVQ